MKSAGLALLASAFLAILAGQAQAQTTPPPAQQQTGQATQPAQTPKPLTPTEAPSLPLSPEALARIREAVSHPPALKVENGQLKIYVEVIAYWPTFAEVA